MNQRRTTALERQAVQIPFSFPLDSHRTFANWFVGPNAEVTAALESLAVGDNQHFVPIWIWGGHSLGKTHLLQATLQHHKLDHAVYLPLKEIRDAAALQGLEGQQLIVLDDINEWLGNAAFEKCLFELYQYCHQARRILIVTSASAPMLTTINLPDLASRLWAMSCFELQPLADEQKQQLLRARAKERGITLTSPLLSYWLTRGSRDIARLLEQLDQLDRLTLERHKPVTRTLLKEVLEMPNP